MKNDLLYRWPSGRNNDGVKHVANKWVHRCCNGRKADGTENGTSQIDGTSLTTTA